MSIANLITRTFTGAAAAAVLAFGFSAGAAAADKVIRIGVTPVPHADIVNFIKPQLEKEGVNLEVVEFLTPTETFTPDRFLPKFRPGKKACGWNSQRI